MSLQRQITLIALVSIHAVGCNLFQNAAGFKKVPKDSDTNDGLRASKNEVGMSKVNLSKYLYCVICY